MDIDFVKSPGGSWHDNINCTVRNNIIVNGTGAGIGFYSARNSFVAHNTILNVGIINQGGILYNLSPKTINNTYSLAETNKNITFANNIVQMHPGNAVTGNLPIVEARVMSNPLPPIVLPSLLPNASYVCSSRRKLNSQKQALQQTVPIRNPDGSCMQFPADNAWHMDVSSLSVHSNAASIKTLIKNGGHLHPDFGASTTINGQTVWYGIPFQTVNTNTQGFPQQAFNPITISPYGYPGESDYPLSYPFPFNVAVEGSYLNCPDSICSGDRHVLVIDNSTCMLYETWRSFPPGVAAQGGAVYNTWAADVAVKFDLSSNNVRPLGFTSSDAAGLPVVPGLVQFDEVIKKGVINHALRFTGANSRAAFEYPARHFAPSGNTGVDSPWMGMRVRLNQTYPCNTLKPVARIFCVALQTYGGIFADNGSPWYFTGESTSKWAPYLSEIADIAKIPASQMLILNTGQCLCLSSDCSIQDCGNGASNPNAPLVVAAVEDNGNDGQAWNGLRAHRFHAHCAR